MPKLLGWLPKRRWLRWTIIIIGTGFMLLVALAVGAYFLLRQPSVQSRLMTMMFRHKLNQPLPTPPSPSLPAEFQVRLTEHPESIDNAGELFVATNIWDVHLHFTAGQWAGLGPNEVPPVPAFNKGDGRVVLRNPEASRPGLAGVLGFDFPWSTCDLELGGRLFTNTAVRFKGNGTFLSGLGSYKRPFKLDLNDHVTHQLIGGRAKLNLANLLAENSMLTDTMGYEFYREAGVPAIRTAFARVLLSLDEKFGNRLLGLYLLIEEPDKKWARETFGTDDVAIFKPVTYEPFQYLGTDWKEYETIYNPKTDVTTAQQQRLIDLTRLCTKADDEEFNRRIGDFIDLPKFATWFACEVTLANYDGFLTTGQNYLVYLDPRTDRFSFGPWDLDHSWGEFPYIGTAAERERASIWHPWTGKNRFLDRTLKNEAFRHLYRAELERLQTKIFQPERLGKRLDKLADLIRPFVTEESTNRLAKFEACVASTWPDGPRDGNPMDPNRPAYPLKRFFKARSESIAAQLAGQEAGVQLMGLSNP